MQTPTPTPNLIESLGKIQVVEALTRVTASPDRRFQMVVVKAVPGASADLLYMCLGNNASPTVYAWVAVATG